MKFSQIDILQIQERGLSVDAIERQINTFKKGNIPVEIEAAATIGNGIFSFSETEKEKFEKHFENLQDHLKILKFVPASGAATRMFKALFTFQEEYNPDSQGLEEYLKHKNDNTLNKFFSNIEDLPFYNNALEIVKSQYPNFESMDEDHQKMMLVEVILFEDGLNLSNQPKGLVPFHNYGSHVATAFEEHLKEGAKYASVKGEVNIHFTISKEHISKFKDVFEDIKERLEEESKLKYNISYSFQDRSTDTIAVTNENQLFRTQHGDLFFRPGGHGALINNLNDQDADIIFIKNIDNVVINKFNAEVADYKKMLAGKLLEVQSRIFNYLNSIERNEIKADDINSLINFLEKELHLFNRDYLNTLSLEEQILYLKEKLNRPLRVCGMVKNQGEPGGGPFLIKNKAGELSLQIIEGAQIDQNNLTQQKIALGATHFNPVDLVCGIKDFKGDKFDLTKFIDPDTSFISQKTNDGKPLKALEHPGLWNGAMANWNTVFVEVPVSTFNPVKNISDLLKSSHQVK